MPKFNINDYVWVKLTKTGHKIHRKYWEPYSNGNYQPAKVSIDGWSRFQLHELMHIFGPEMRMGANLPFASEIILDCDRPIMLEDLQEGQADAFS
ncbi:hypothetical protein [Roseovarius sp. MMSF_3281]|uniref:hypothetical protein n=1 Tax=Roseovarius sp. MMSF_3281 TaxID=3046694 RepID=UPI00273F2022|nr:hypothetical protein [Roseovarius sp. MMSF_3281]